MKSHIEIQADLNNCRGGFDPGDRVRHFFIKWLVFSKGIQIMREACECYWLMDHIASIYLKKGVRCSIMEEGIHFWKLVQVEECGVKIARIIGEIDEGKVLYSEDINFTDFPFGAFENKEFRVWVSVEQHPDADSPIFVMHLPEEN